MSRARTTTSSCLLYSMRTCCKSRTLSCRGKKARIVTRPRHRETSDVHWVLDVANHTLHPSENHCISPCKIMLESKWKLEDACSRVSGTVRTSSRSKLNPAASSWSAWQPLHLRGIACFFWPLARSPEVVRDHTDITHTSRGK